MQPESAFVTSSDGTHTRISLGDLGGYGGDAVKSSAINNAGRIAGDSPTRYNRISHVFLWVNGAMTDLGTLDGASSYAADINLADEIVGFAETPSGTRAFRYGDSTLTDLGSFGGAFSTKAAAINDAGQIVGGSTLAGEDPQAQRAFLYLGGTMYDLNDLVEPIPDTLRWFSPGKSTIAARSLLMGSVDPGRTLSPYVLTSPVSPP